VAQPTRRIPRELLERVSIEVDGVEHRARVEGGRVSVGGALTAITWADPVSPDEIEVRLGAKVPALLKDIAFADPDCLVAGAVIIAALIGHPRKDPRGQPIKFVWTDHVSLASSGDPSRAMDHSWVRDPQAAHTRAMSGRMRLRGC
jgi:hypothetical protein